MIVYKDAEVKLKEEIPEIFAFHLHSTDLCCNNRKNVNVARSNGKFFAHLFRSRL